jgi:hypothetical protein
MLLLQDASINDVNEMVKKSWEIFSSILLLVCLGANHSKSHFVKKIKLKISHGLT